MKKCIALMLSAATLITCLAACSSSSSGNSSSPAPSGSTPVEESKAPATSYDLDYGGSNSSGAMFRWNAAACDIVNKYNDNINLSPMATIGSSENAELANLGEVAFSSVSSTITYLAYSGQSNWEGNPLSNLRVVYAMYPDQWECFVAADSGITSVKDLEGKRVSFDAKGTSADVNLLVYKALGYEDPEKTFNAYFTNASDSPNAIAEGTLDAYSTVGGVTVSGFSTLSASSHGVGFVSLTPEEQEAVCKVFPMMNPVTVDASYWEGCTTFESVGSCTVVVASVDTPDDLVYQFVKTMEEHHDELVAAYGEMAETATAENTVRLWGSEEAVPLHPGAKQYFQELGLM